MAAVALGRRASVAEIDQDFATLARKRLHLAATAANPSEEEAVVPGRTIDQLWRP